MLDPTQIQRIISKLAEGRTPQIKSADLKEVSTAAKAAGIEMRILQQRAGGKVQVVKVREQS